MQEKRCKICSVVRWFYNKDLEKSNADKFASPIIQPMLDCEWKHFVTSKIAKMRGETYAYVNEEVWCFDGERLLGTEKDLLSWAREKFHYQDFRPDILYDAIAEEAYKDYFIQNQHKIVFMDVSINTEDAGTLVFELFNDVCPKTCENFRSLCEGGNGKSEEGLTLQYMHTLFHRIVPNGWVQGGDILQSCGDAGASIYGKFFEDENYIIKHDRRGVLGMANQGRHTNGSQFYITLQPAPWMDTKFVAFGRLIEGSQLLNELENVPTENERPVYDCRIQECGIYSMND